MNVIDGQAGLVIYSSLIFYSLTIDNILNIVVLLILAGITINMVFSENGIIKKTQDTKIQAEIAEIEEKANLIYTNLKTDKYLVNSSSDIALQDVIAELIAEDHQIEQIALSDGGITGIALDKSSISIAMGATAEIIVTFEGNQDNYAYYAVVDGKYYKMTLTNGGIKIDKTESKVEGETSPNTLTAVSSNTDCVTIGTIGTNTITINGGTKGGTSTVTVTYGSFEKTCEVTVVLRPIEGSTPDDTTTFSTTYGTVDVIWLNRTSNTVATTPNSPANALTSNEGFSMTPVVFNAGTNAWDTTTTSDSNWYQYNAGSTQRRADGKLVDNTTNRWANAKTANESYFVWIPRYAYRITYYASETSVEPTGYYDGYGMWNAEDGTIKYALESGIETVEYNGEKYIVHPAFGTNLDLGGWSSPLTGFWFAKFEMSGSSGSALKSTYGTASTREQTIGAQYTSGITATYGYTITTANADGNKSFMNSHMIKNSEWGAVAYLTQSKYGRNGNEITKNTNLSYYRGGGSGTAYITNASQSTTGNVYGIYDMSGGAHEHVAGFDKLGSSTYLGGSDYGLNMTKNAKDTNGNYISTKYITTYSNGTSTASGTLIYTVGKTGDATKEVYTGSGTEGWFSDHSDLVGFTRPFYSRGSSVGSTTSFNPGVFCSRSMFGNTLSDTGFRTALCP